MIIGFLIIGLIALTGCQQAQENTIEVSGDAEITVEPDEAEVRAGISIVKDTAEEAQNEANRVINAIVDSLKKKGYENIETERLNLREQRTWTKDEGSKIVGWRASQTLKIKTEELGKVGEIVDVCINNGANEINNIQFQLSEEEEQKYKKQALAEATKSAKAKAETIAESLGVSLGKIKTVSESSFRYAPYMYAMENVVGAEAVEEAATVMPKDVTVTANIQLVYYVK